LPLVRRVNTLWDRDERSLQLVLATARFSDALSKTLRT
jgi:hypothetical protein